MYTSYLMLKSFRSQYGDMLHDRQRVSIKQKLLRGRTLTSFVVMGETSRYRIDVILSI